MDVDKMFAQHTPTPAQKGRMNTLRICALMLARENPKRNSLWSQPDACHSAC